MEKQQTKKKRLSRAVTEEDCVRIDTEAAVHWNAAVKYFLSKTAYYVGDSNRGATHYWRVTLEFPN